MFRDFYLQHSQGVLESHLRHDRAPESVFCSRFLRRHSVCDRGRTENRLNRNQDHCRKWHAALTHIVMCPFMIIALYISYNFTL